MNQNETQAMLAQLHAELSRVTEVDDATRQALNILLADIQRLTSIPAKTSVPGDKLEPSMASRLRSTIQDIESKHPQMTGLLQQVVDRLADMGI